MVSKTGAILVSLLAVLGPGHARRGRAPAWAVQDGAHAERQLAALAFRDTVPEYQRLGSKGFTLNYLTSELYNRVEYLEEDALGAETHARFVATLSALLEANDAVDLFLLVNGSPEYATWVAEVPEALRGKLRLVYSTDGSGGEQVDAWKRLGIGAFVYHPGRPGYGNLAPFFYVDFLRLWASGERLDEVVRRANAAFHKRLHGVAAKLVLQADGMPTDEAELERWERGTQARWAGQASFSVR